MTEQELRNNAVIIAAMLFQPNSVDKLCDIADQILAYIMVEEEQTEQPEGPFDQHLIYHLTKDQ